MHKVPHSLVALALLGACLVAGVALANADALKSDQRLAFELEQQRLHAERSQHLAEQYLPFWSLVAYGGLVVGVGWVGPVGVQPARGQCRAAPSDRPRCQGRFPIPDPTQFRADVAAQVAALMVHGQLQAPLEAARTHQDGASTCPDAPWATRPRLCSACARFHRTCTRSPRNQRHLRCRTGAAARCDLADRAWRDCPGHPAGWIAAPGALRTRPPLSRRWPTPAQERPD